MYLLVVKQEKISTLRKEKKTAEEREYRRGAEVYREQLSHLEHGPRTFYKNQQVASRDVLGYIGTDRKYHRSASA